MDYKDGLRYPSIDQLVEKTGSKYKLVIAAAKRAREIKDNGRSFIKKPHSKKCIGQALEEIYEGKIIVK
ncbi:MAG: DNA-directed RNA polymerase subunit omega [Acholeplasmataceae bacterium]|nr:DNA-directed RNA polymerase subunit omega [Acholeplasmataceae bacterium]HOA63641.1 DNA-directed RNA polymerase subunit omega [Bacilli bacterium]HPT89815.1 DNA-directed RNA polymerase subunit omega [Bacilli bacterium]HQD92124.1 DNA-directed RNA polymerase subunit omega [Bacilli bacterium]